MLINTECPLLYIALFYGTKLKILTQVRKYVCPYSTHYVLLSGILQEHEFDHFQIDTITWDFFFKTLVNNSKRNCIHQCLDHTPTLYP